jgi:hypothetical protein
VAGGRGPLDPRATSDRGGPRALRRGCRSAPGVSAARAPLQPGSAAVSGYSAPCRSRSWRSQTERRQQALPALVARCRAPAGRVPAMRPPLSTERHPCPCVVTAGSAGRTGDLNCRRPQRAGPPSPRPSPRRPRTPITRALQRPPVRHSGASPNERCGTPTDSPSCPME